LNDLQLSELLIQNLKSGSIARIDNYDRIFDKASVLSMISDFSGGDSVNIYYRRFLEDTNGGPSNKLMLIEHSAPIFRLSFEQMATIEIYTTLILKFRSLDMNGQIISESLPVNFLVQRRFDEGLSFSLSAEANQYSRTWSNYPTIVGAVSGSFPKFGIQLLQTDPPSDMHLKLKKPVKIRTFEDAIEVKNLKLCLTEESYMNAISLRTQALKKKITNVKLNSLKFFNLGGNTWTHLDRNNEFLTLEFEIDALLRIPDDFDSEERKSYHSETP
jgi:hypothetical protein